MSANRRHNQIREVHRSARLVFAANLEANDALLDVASSFVAPHRISSAQCLPGLCQFPVQRYVATLSAGEPIIS